MANYFVDDTTGDSGDSGSTMDYAWPTIKYAVEQASKLTAGDIVWVRRGHDEWNGDTATADITPNNTQDGTRKNPIQVIGWPRNTYSVTSASWNNGSAIVSSILPATITKKQHCGRFVTAPNGKQYLITIIDAGDSMRIDREYSGGDTSGVGGAFTIKADEDYDLAQTIGDSGWTITKSDYNGDTHDLPLVDFGGGSFQVDQYGTMYWNYKNLDFRSSLDSNGILYLRNTYEVLVQGCLFYQDENTHILRVGYGGQFFIKRCIFEGNQTGASQRGILAGAYTSFYLIDSAVYGLGDHGFYNNTCCYFRNVNIGVEKTNGDDDIYIGQGSIIYGYDVKLGGNVKEVDFAPGYQTPNGPRVHIENYQKVLGAHKTFVLDDNSYYEKIDVVLNSGDPEKRSDGANSIIKLVFSTNTAYNESQEYLTSEIFCHEFYGDTTSKSYRYYVQLDAIASLTADQLWIEVEYVDSYNDDTAYTVTQKVSDEATTLRGDTSDWNKYIEVTDVQPAKEGTIRIRCYAQFYDADGKLYIDPQVFIY